MRHPGFAAPVPGVAAFSQYWGGEVATIDRAVDAPRLARIRRPLIRRMFLGRRDKPDLH
jgi:hypothetical protein